MDTVEIMSPVGSYESLAAAIKAGADSVYFGVEGLNMRAKSSNNFSLADLAKIAGICKDNGVKTYLALNTVMYDSDIPLIKKICDAAKNAGISAVIAADIAVMTYANSIGLAVHMSTQVNISNILAVKFFSRFADTIVLARELTLEQIEMIIKEIEEQDIRGPNGALVRVEIFAHGALCVSISGKCHMSLASYNESANRGACLQMCRRGYRVTDEETGEEFLVDNKYIMSPKDLCTIQFVDRLIGAGVSVLKLEGRGRSPDYVYTVTKCYKEAVGAVLDGTFSKEKSLLWEKELATVYNRGFWQGGYYLGKRLGEWAGTYGSKATKEKTYLGVCKNYYAQKKIAHFSILAGELNLGDEIMIIGETTGVVICSVDSLFAGDIAVSCAKKGDEVTIPIAEKVRPNDKLYVRKERIVKE